MKSIFLIIFTFIKLKNAADLEAFVDTDDFQTLLLNSDLFVDKSLLVKEFLETSSSLNLIVRPSGWGKSVNMDMLRRFFQPEVHQNGTTLMKSKTTNGKLFLGGEIHIAQENKTKHLNALKISQKSGAEQSMGKYPVIMVKFKNTAGTNYSEIVDKISSRIREAFEDHRYLLNSSKITLVQELEKYFDTENINETNLAHCLYFLSWKLFEYFGENVIILIDDYDAPITNGYIRFGAKSPEFTKLQELLKGLYQTAFNFNPHIRKGILSGRVKVSFASSVTESGLSNLDTSTMFQAKFSDFFGLKCLEVQTLLCKVPHEINMRDIKRWYGGYHFNHHQDSFYYNTRSTIQCLCNNATLQDYSPDTNASTALIDKLLVSDALQPQLHKLVSNQRIDRGSVISNKFIQWDRIDIIEILLLNGYVRFMKIPFEDGHSLIIPNKEMISYHVNKVLQWVIGKFAINTAEFYSLTSTLTAGNIEEFEKRLKKYFSNASSYIETLDEQAEVFIISFMIALQKSLDSSHSTSVNDAVVDISINDEILLVPKIGYSDTAVAINYKRVLKNMDFMASASILEIQSSLYEKKLKAQPHIKKLIKIGIAFNGDKLVVKQEVDNL